MIRSILLLIQWRSGTAVCSLLRDIPPLGDCAIAAALCMRIMRTCACTGCVAGAVGGAGARAGAVVGARAFAVAVAGLRARVRLLAPARLRLRVGVRARARLLVTVRLRFRFRGCARGRGCWRPCGCGCGGGCGGGCARGYGGWCPRGCGARALDANARALLWHPGICSIVSRARSDLSDAGRLTRTRAFVAAFLCIT